MSRTAQRQRTLVYLNWNDFLQFLEPVYPPPHALQIVPIDMPYLLPDFSIIIPPPIEDKGRRPPPMRGRAVEHAEQQLYFGRDGLLARQGVPVAGGIWSVASSGRSGVGASGAPASGAVGCGGEARV